MVYVIDNYGYKPSYNWGGPTLYDLIRDGLWQIYLYSLWMLVGLILEDFEEEQSRMK